MIPGAPEAGYEATLLEVPVNSVTPNPKQPRTHWDADEIQALAASIREVGILQPIVVRRSGEGAYELVAGNGDCGRRRSPGSLPFQSCSAKPTMPTFSARRSSRTSTGKISARSSSPRPSASCSTTSA